MNRYCFLFYLLLSLFIGSCSTQELPNTHIYGRAIDAYTGEGVSGIRITIYETEFPYFPSLRSELEDIILETDKEGNYSYHFFPRGGLKSYRYSVSTAGIPHLSIEEKIPNQTSISVNKDNRFDFLVTYNGYLQESYINTNCDSAITLEVTRQLPIPEAINNLTFELENCQSIRRDNDEVRQSPQGIHTYIWRTLRDGEVLTENRDSFYLEIGERKEFTIEW